MAPEVIAIRAICVLALVGWIVAAWCLVQLGRKETAEEQRKEEAGCPNCDWLLLCCDAKETIICELTAELKRQRLIAAAPLLVNRQN